MSKSLLSRILDRYKNIVPDWNLFLESCDSPLPLCFWRNQLRIEEGEFDYWLSRHSIDAEKSNWDPLLYTLKSELGENRLGSSLLYLTGLLHIQEAVSVLPSRLARLSSSSRVLDLCGAPGGKTVSAAQLMDNKGLILCNDSNGYRLKAVRGTLDRLGITNTMLSCLNGVNYPRSNNQFDRILVDAPCSCEGTLRKNSEITKKVSEKSIERISNIQELLLERALQIVEPNGLVVYSTCTFAPEENERVVSNVLNSTKIAAEILPINLPNFNYSPGLLEWDGQEFISGIEKSMRVWPHQNDTGGFFVSIIRRTS